MNRPPRVVVADDQALVRTGFRLILDADGIDVVAEATDGTEAVDAVRRTRPDVVLMDIRMPDMDGLEATRRILTGSQDGPRVVMLTTFDLDHYVYAALAAGASGFLLKDVTPEHLVAAIRTVRAGDALLAPAITRRLVERFAHRTPETAALHRDLAALTPRELDVLRLLAQGLSNAELATGLHLSEATVKTHVSRIPRQTLPPRPGPGGRGRVRDGTRQPGRAGQGGRRGRSRVSGVRCRRWSLHRRSRLSRAGVPARATGNTVCLSAGPGQQRSDRTFGGRGR